MPWQSREISNRYAPRVGTSGLGVYPLTRGQVTTFFSDLWTVTLIEKAADWLFGDPMDSIISLRWYYGIKSNIKRVNQSTYVTLGNQAFKGEFGTGQPIISTPASSEYVHVDCGKISIPEKFKDFRDIEPYTRLEIFIPFVGMVQLNAVDFIQPTGPESVYGAAMNGIGLQYNINLITGAATAFVTRHIAESDTYAGRIVYIAQCQMGVDIPVNVNAKEDLLNRMATGMAGVAMAAGAASIAPAFAAGAAGSVVAGQSVGAGVAQATVGGLGNTAGHMLNHSVGGNRMGGLESEMASLASFKPFVRMTRKMSTVPKGFSETMGLPSASIIKMSDAVGYVKAAGISNASSPKVPQEAMAEIEQLLKGGVYSV